MHITTDVAYWGAMSSRPTLPDIATLDAQALRLLVLTQHQTLTAQAERIQAQGEELAGRQAEITRLKLLIAKLQRMQFGRRSERGRIQRSIARLM